MRLYFAGNLYKPISPFILFPQPSPGHWAPCKGHGEGKREGGEARGSASCPEGVGPAPECEPPLPELLPLPRAQPISLYRALPAHLILDAVHEVIESGVRQPLIQSQLQPHTSWVTLGKLVTVALRIK